MFDATKANLIKKIFNKLGANINISKDSNQFFLVKILLNFLVVHYQNRKKN